MDVYPPGAATSFNVTVALSPCRFGTVHVSPFITAPLTTSVQVPDVTGETVSAAATSLAQVGLTLGTELKRCSASTPRDIVISTSPSAGTPIEQGTFIDLLVSSGPCPVKVPDVIGETLQAASASLTSMQLKPVPVTRCPAGEVTTSTVTSQSPLPTTLVHAGTAVTITFCAPQGNSGTTGTVHLRP
jgi:beta-lactam-binding protein with PASTA domain